MSVIIAFLLFAIVMLELVILGVMHEQGKQFSKATVTWVIDARGADPEAVERKVRDAILAQAQAPRYDA